MDTQKIVDAANRLFSQIGLTEHSFLLICIGIIIAYVLMGGHRHIRYHYGRFRNYYDGYRRRYRDRYY